jgi:Bacterial self-protective colicin-like immunity
MLLGEATGGVLESATRFTREWLAAGHKRIVPLPLSASNPSPLVAYVDVCRRAGHAEVLVLATDSLHAREEALLLSTADPGDHWPRTPRAPCLMTPTDRSSGLLATISGYGLLAGSAEFLALALPEGIEGSLVDFGRYAKRASRRHGVLASIAAEFPGSRVTRKTGRDLDPTFGAGRQVHLMEQFAARQIDSAAFSIGWLSARTESLESRERLGHQLEILLNGVFYSLDEYNYDPALAQPGDLSTVELRNIVREALVAISHL